MNVKSCTGEGRGCPTRISATRIAGNVDEASSFVMCVKVPRQTQRSWKLRYFHVQHFSDSAHTQRVGMAAICSALCSWTDKRIPVRTVRHPSEDMTQICRLLSQRLSAVKRLAVLAVIVVRSRRLGISRRSAWLLRGGRGLSLVVGLAVLAPVKVCAGRGGPGGWGGGGLRRYG